MEHPSVEQHGHVGVDGHPAQLVRKRAGLTRFFQVSKQRKFAYKDYLVAQWHF